MTAVVVNSTATTRIIGHGDARDDAECSGQEQEGEADLDNLTDPGEIPETVEMVCRIDKRFKMLSCRYRRGKGGMMFATLWID